jgi:hypothetical protein
VEESYEAGMNILRELMSLEESLNHLHILIDEVQRLDSSPGKARSTSTLQLVFKTISGNNLLRFYGCLSP